MYSLEEYLQSIQETILNIEHNSLLLNISFQMQ